MKQKKTVKFCLTILAMFIIGQTSLFAQAANEKAAPPSEQKKSEPASEPATEEPTKKPHPRDAYDPAERPEENYLARFDAIKVSEELTKKNVENIYMLKVIVSNFKDQGWEKEYEDIYNQYKKGVSLFYRRHVIYSRVELEKNKKAISDLFKKVVNVYEIQTQDMLAQCADKILDFSLDERNKFDPNRNRVLFKNMMRLWIAYGQTDDSERSKIDGDHKTSIFHLRIAKSYGITILEQLDPVNSKGKFKTHKADNLNRILAPETAKSSSPSTTK